MRDRAAQYAPEPPERGAAGRTSRETHFRETPRPALAPVPQSAPRSERPVQLRGVLEPAILHLRIPHFAATVALRERGLDPAHPLIVIDTEARAGVVLAASPAARAGGVAAGIAASAARALCPAALIVPLAPEALIAAAREIEEVLGQYTPIVSPDWLTPRDAGSRRARSTPAGGLRDESRAGRAARAAQADVAPRQHGVQRALIPGHAARPHDRPRPVHGSAGGDIARLARSLGIHLDVRGCERLFGPSSVIARHIVAELADCGYRAQAGIAANAALAAVASAIAAPEAPRMVAAGDERRFLDDLPLQGRDGEPPLLDLHPDLLGHLQALGMRRVGELARLPSSALRRRFGDAGADAHAQANGVAARQLPLRPAVETIAAERRLEDPTLDGVVLDRALGLLSATLADRLAGQGRAAGEIGIVAIDEQDRPLARSLQLKQPIAGAPAIHERAGALLMSLSPATPICLLRVDLAALLPAATQRALFPAAGARTNESLDALAARLRDRFGPRAARRARVLPCALLPEELVVWDPAHPRPRAGRPLAVRLDPAGLPAAVRRDDGAWESVRGIHSQWRLRSHWWAELTHRHYYLLETTRGTVLELYQELTDGSWQLTGTRD